MLQQDKCKILYIAPSFSSFVKNDIEILSTTYHVIWNVYSWRKKHLLPFFLLGQVFFLMRNVFSADKIFVSFGGYWSLLPALFGKLTKTDVFIILNGTDCASIPRLNYGYLRKPLMTWFCKKSYQLAAKLLPVSASLVSTHNIYNGDDRESNQGYYHFFPNLRTPHEVIWNGVRTDFWEASSDNIKEKGTFMAVFSGQQYYLKGGDLIFQMSHKFPQCKFYIAGCDAPSFLENIPGNLIFLGSLAQEKLKEYYLKSQFYFQISIFEGFGCSLCEAMLCQCIPIGSSVNMIPEIIDETGFVLQKRDINMLETMIQTALKIEDKEGLGKLAKQRVMNHYSLQSRFQKIDHLISNSK